MVDHQLQTPCTSISFGVTSALADAFTRAKRCTMETLDVLRREIKALAFDQYGTIVNMQTGLTEVVTPFLKEKGWDGEPNSFVTWWRRTHFENSMIDALCDRGHTPYRQIGHRAVSFVMDRCGIAYTQEEVTSLVSEIEKLKPFPDVVAALEKLQFKGYRLAILSNGDRDMLKRPGLTSVFRSISHFGAGGWLFQAALEGLCESRGDHWLRPLQHSVRC